MSQSNYDDYAADQKTEFYRENFNSPDPTWESYISGERMGKIHDGYFDWVSLNDISYAKYVSIPDMDWDSDWQLEIRMKHVSGEDNSSNDILWDREPGNPNKYHFGFTSGGAYNISVYDEGYQRIVGFTESDLINKTGFNKITVRKVRGTYYFFFNEQYITSSSYFPVKGDDVGFTVPANSIIQVDYIDVSYLAQKSSAIASSTLPSGMNYVGVMTKYNGYNLQRWKTRDAFPKDEIKSDWDDDFYVSDVSYDNDKWSLITSKGTGYSAQTWFTRNEWPKEDIKEKWIDGYQITELNYGNGVWAFIFSKNSGYTRQRWATVTTFPSAKIDEYVEDDLWITEISYGLDHWALVGSKDASIVDQKWFKKAQLPESEVKEYQALGYSITQLSQENNWWVLILSKYDTNRPQELITSSTFPKDQIRDYWDQGYYLTDISYGTTNVQNDYTSTRAETADPNSNISELLVGTWYDGGVNEREKGYMIFDSERYTTMINQGDTLGGKGWVNEGIAIELKYEINSATSPQEIDLTFESQGLKFGSMKGIIRMIDKDTFELCLATDDITAQRPSTFENKGDITTTVFKRVK